MKRKTFFELNHHSVRTMMTLFKICLVIQQSEKTKINDLFDDIVDDSYRLDKSANITKVIQAVTKIKFFDYYCQTVFFSA